MPTTQQQTTQNIHFKARKGTGIVYQIVLQLSFGLLMLYFSEFHAGEHFDIILGSMGIVIILNVFFTLWSSVDTNYHIDGDQLYYRATPFQKGVIDIAEIRELQRKDLKFLWMKLTPALSRHGILIKYNKYDELYIAPEDREDFVKHLLAINPDIKVEGFDLEQ